MPYSSVESTRKRIPALKNMSEKAVRAFMHAFNSSYEKDKDETKAIKIGVNAAKKVKKQIIVKEDLSKIEKATFKDVKELLENAIKEKFLFENGYIESLDFDPEFVYIEVEYSEYKGNSNYRYYEVTYKIPYSLDGVTVSLGQNLIKVEKETKYTEVKDKVTQFYEDGNVNRSLEWVDEMINKAVDKIFKRKNKEETAEDNHIYIEKFQEDEMIAVEVMYSYPDEADGHKEGMTSDTIRKMVESANKALDEGRLSAGLFHSENRDDIEFLKIWVNECDCYIGDTFVPEGSALVKTKFHNKDLWDMRKSGELGGLSIGAKGDRVKNVEGNEDE